MLRSAHFHPNLIGITVLIVDPVMVNLNPQSWNIFDIEVHIRWRIVNIVIMIVPYHDRGCLSIQAGQAIYVGVATDSFFYHITNSIRVILSFNCHPVASHHAEHTHYIENRFVDIKCC